MVGSSLSLRLGEYMYKKTFSREARRFLADQRF